MLTREQFLSSCDHEIKVIKHLATKLPPGGARYRPSPQQRSTLELMQYLTTCAIVPATAAVNGNWDHAESIESAAAKITPENFGLAMDRQARALRELLSRVPHADLQHRNAQLPWGTPVKLGEALLTMAFKPLVAYRMQLFLYLKASGRTELGPAQCWLGVDPRPA
jgi:hypothetical protein